MTSLALLAWAAASAAEAPPVGVYLDLERRALALAEHLAHGPGFAFGATFFEDHLRVGLAGFARPGPNNPAVFPVDASYGEADQVAPRSDGGATGLVVSPGATFGRVRWDAPLLLGYGGFGFYLHGADRATPDGREPSAWENELLDGRDSSLVRSAYGGPSLGLGVAVGAS